VDEFAKKFDMHVELGMGTKHVVKGFGIVPFNCERVRPS
jgi:hypothetical protein